MKCEYAKYDRETNRYICSVTEDECVYLIPNQDQCIADEYIESEDDE